MKDPKKKEKKSNRLEKSCHQLACRWQASEGEDYEAFALFVESIQPWLRRILSAECNTPLEENELDDALQETLRTLARVLLTKFDGRPVLPYAKTIAVRILKRAKSKSAGRNEVNGPSEEAVCVIDDAAKHYDLMDGELGPLAALLEVVPEAGLTKLEYEVAMKKICTNKTSEKIGRELGKSAVAIDKAWSRVKEKLQNVSSLRTYVVGERE